MTRGFYAAASGLITCTTAINVIGNNIVNVNTAGYKENLLVTKAFDEFLAVKMGGGDNQGIGSLSHGVVADEICTLYQEGTLNPTGRALDMAIQGEGFFTLRTAEGATLLTRNGGFSVNSEGNLIDAAGNLLLGENGPIAVTGTTVFVTEAGEVFADDLSCGKLLITCPADLTALVQEGDNLFSYAGQDNNAFTGSIRQGYLESSNVDLVKEMAGMMSVLRSYQSCSQILKMIDKVNEKSVNELARL